MLLCTEFCSAWGTNNVSNCIGTLKQMIQVFDRYKFCVIHRRNLSNNTDFQYLPLLLNG